MSVLAPATLEGWYALHQVFGTAWSGLRSLDHPARSSLADEVRDWLGEATNPPSGGWSAAFRLVAGGGDWMLIHFRPTLDELAEIGLRLRRSRFGELLRLTYDYISVTEAGLYHATAETAAEHQPGSPEFQRALDARVEAERASPHLQTRLYPSVPDGMRYVSFYPMSKRRAPAANWYTLPVGERNRLMREHGMTGRRYAGRIFQVITGSVGLDDWEWGVTLFARDPLEFKRIVTDMRYDQASAEYGEFGEFFTGIRLEPDEWAELLVGAEANR